MSVDGPYTFDARREDGSPRRYIGLWRPPLEEARRIVADRNYGYVPDYWAHQIVDQWQRTGGGVKALTSALSAMQARLVELASSAL